MYPLTCALAGLIGLLTVLAGVSGCAETEVPMADIAAVVKGDNEFAFDLYARLRDQDGNLFFSPDSISTALAMTYAGARGETAEQMAKTLHFTLDAEHLHPAFRALIEQRNRASKKRDYELRVANALWGQKGLGFLPSFLKLTADDYGAGLREVDFQGATETARQAINAWVEQQTNDKIKELLAQGSVGPSTKLVLTNAIYFKGDWATKFDKRWTTRQPFHTSATQSSEVDMMHQEHHFKYWDGDTVQALEMPYKGEELSMVVLLPRKADGLAELEKELSAAQLTAILSKLRSQKVDVMLPKFKTTREFSLGKTLAAMGMPLAFGPGADLSGMTGEHGLFIGEVVHKAFVDVNEQGTEAAAATGVIVRLLAAPSTTFHADHPFIFLIRDSKSGSILFLGRMVKP